MSATKKRTHADLPPTKPHFFRFEFNLFRLRFGSPSFQENIPNFQFFLWKSNKRSVRCFLARITFFNPTYMPLLYICRSFSLDLDGPPNKYFFRPEGWGRGHLAKGLAIRWVPCLKGFRILNQGGFDHVTTAESKNLKDGIQPKPRWLPLVRSISWLDRSTRPGLPCAITWRRRFVEEWTLPPPIGRHPPLRPCPHGIYSLFGQACPQPWAGNWPINLPWILASPRASPPAGIPMPRSLSLWASTLGTRELYDIIILAPSLIINQFFKNPLDLNIVVSCYPRFCNLCMIEF